MAKNKVYIFRCKEQGTHCWYNEEVVGTSLKEACEKLANRYLLDYGIGTYYLWVIKVQENGNTIFSGPERMFDILQTLREE